MKIIGTFALIAAAALAAALVGSGTPAPKERTLAQVSAALAGAPDSPALYVERARLYVLIYEWDAALADYTRAIALDPAYADAYFQRGVLYYTRANYSDAQADLRHYLALASEGAQAADARAYLAQMDALNRALGQ